MSTNFPQSMHAADRQPATKAHPLAGVLELHAGETVQFPDTDYRSVIRRGLWILALGFGGFLLWATLAPLDEGIPAAGVVMVESNRKRIDHPSGGVVERILVREGQVVQAGEDLLILNETQARSALNATLSQWHTALAMRARLDAERDGAAAIRVPPELAAAGTDDPAVEQLLRMQEDLFASRRSALEGEQRIVRESVRGLESQLASLGSLRRGREKQVALFEEQLASYRKLNDQGFVSRNHLVDIERQLAEVQSRQSEDLSNIAATNARLSEFRMRDAQLEIEFRRNVETQLAEVQREVAVLGERLAAQRDTVDRLALKAPVSGVVVDLAIHTIGGVIKPGERILDVVPQADELVVEARVQPQHIDRLHAGLAADVHFDAYASRVERPVVQGQVEVVSADVIVDQRSGEGHYTMRVRVPPEQKARLGDLRLQPGMQTTVMVKTGERSLMVYLLRPLLRRFTTALSE
ncbi:Type I secretion system membrane fusion protein PrsE [Thauera sp. GDN1]|uniref:HlyD family type I secretion periplasmic adaptor subunit n=1 Tax=Thauera sp. GDN1 TaxID=2944810 RepID=UPI00247AB63F|nr:HlyD family type I secretion periplasmic adaptor subunit [Thauera sp. GDN1]WEN40563.1 Type I secretion system membrane fusion protein PrsE [Thauera sp. GDN1]